MNNAQDWPVPSVKPDLALLGSAVDNQEENAHTETLENDKSIDVQSVPRDYNGVNARALVTSPNSQRMLVPQRVASDMGRRTMTSEVYKRPRPSVPQLNTMGEHMHQPAPLEENNYF